jgi:hypothetical protein
MIFTCPKGHIVNKETMKCSVSLTEPDIDKATIFVCEAGTKFHQFSLKTAIREKMFTKEQAERLRVQAEEHRRKYGYKSTT